jgi:hypothetical protein
MPMQSDTEQAIVLMSDFAKRTGLTAGNGEPQRYLWTDAFAMMNALALWRETGEQRWRDLAESLIAQVHGVLGKRRRDDARSGWLSGLGEEEGERHPTAGGLRIGKPLSDRRPGEPYDESLEGDRDGQYWHYLTKWMDALSRAAIFLDQPCRLHHAIELATATLPRFLRTSASGEPSGLAWKMSVDLSRLVVTGTSPHDALDGYVIFRWLGRTGQNNEKNTGLDQETATLLRLAVGHGWSTTDPLGLGGLLLDAMRLAILPDRNPTEERMIARILSDVQDGLKHFIRSSGLDKSAARRLAFRELGLTIGLQALGVMSDAANESDSFARAAGQHLAALQELAGLGERITTFWSEPANRRAASWTGHQDINEVMLATALLRAFVGTGRGRPN